MTYLNFFSSPIGLGHVTRDYAITESLQNNEIKFVTGSGAARFLSSLGCTVTDAYNPPHFNVQKGLLNKSSRWLWSYYQYYRECKKIASKIIQEDNPKVVVSDEDFASLTVAQSRKIPNVLITDILETRFTKGLFSFIERKMNKSMQEIISKCDYVIIPEFGEDKENLRRVGPIVRETNFSREELRKKLGFTKKTVTISIGGTNAGEFLIEKALEVLSKKNDLDTIVVSGPSSEKKYNGVRNLGFVKNLHEIIFASDLLISLAGKSTIDEALAYGTPAIFIPIKDHFEQEDNAKEIGFKFEDIYRLEELVEEKLQEKRNPSRTNGARKAREIILEVINSI